MFGHDPELPNGFQDADFEMRALEEEANRLHRETMAHDKRKLAQTASLAWTQPSKEPAFGTKDFANGSWGNTQSPDKMLEHLVDRFGPKQLLDAIAQICLEKKITCSLNSNLEGGD
jgi:hypothetical protein